MKSFHDDAAIGEAMRKGDIYVGKRSHHRSNTVESAIDDAIKQLRATASTANSELRLIALIARTVYGPDVTARQILGTLYGIRSVLDGAEPGKSEPAQCLYFSHSAFFRYRRELDGAIVIDDGSVMVCLNDHSRRIQRLRQSGLGFFFAQQGALNDARALEERGFLLADCDVDRNDEEAVCRYVADKYGLCHAIVVTPTEHSAMMKNETR